MTQSSPTQEAQAREVLARQLAPEETESDAEWRAWLVEKPARLDNTGIRGHQAIRAMLAFADQPRPIETGEVIQADRNARLAEDFGKTFRSEQENNYGCAGDIECTFKMDGNCHCFNATLAAHRLAFASPLHGEREADRSIVLTPAEIQCGHSRVKWAEGLILQLPTDHDGRNNWLLNYGEGDEAAELRLRHNARRAERGLQPAEFAALPVSSKTGEG